MAGVTDYLSQFQALLPPGAAFSREPDADLTKLLTALADEFARVDQRATDLRDEADPYNTVEMLADWERVAGLPDACTGAMATIYARQLALVGKLSAVGGQSRAYFIGLAATLGYEITITEYSARRHGDLHGDLYGNTDWNFVWQVNAPATTINNRLYGRSYYGEPYRTWGYQQLECIIEALKPAHTRVIFSYGG